MTIFTDRNYYYRNPEKAYDRLRLGLLLGWIFGGSSWAGQFRSGDPVAGTKLVLFTALLFLMLLFLRAVILHSFIELSFDEGSLTIIDRQFPTRNYRETIPRADFRRARIVESRLFPNFIYVRWKQRRLFSVRAHDLDGLLTQTRLVELELKSGRKILLDGTDPDSLIAAIEATMSLG